MELRVFHNVCSHRATKLFGCVSGNCDKRIVCTYFAWSYDLSGNLKYVPGFDDFEDLDLKNHGLRVVEHEIFQGFVFAKVLSSDVPPVSVQFKPYLAEIEPYRFADLEPLGQVILRPRKVNWKQIPDNYVDAIRIPVAHPGLSNLVGGSYDLEVSVNGGFLHRMSADLTASGKTRLSNVLYKKYLPRVDDLPADRQWQWTYCRLWPNLAFNVYPDQMDFMQFIPINASTTMIREIPFGLKDDRREMKLARYLNWRINREVNAEDNNLFKWVQEGMQSSAFESGLLAKSEICLIDNAKKIRCAIPVSILNQEPASEEIQGLNQELTSSSEQSQKIN